MRNRTRAEIDRLCDTMKIGQCLDVFGSDLRDAYPFGWPTIYETVEQAFLSSKTGAAWGAWTVKSQYPDRDVYTISRNEPGDKRVYADPDQMHHFAQMPDGTLQPIDNPDICINPRA
ncbi:hypothetical protein [Parvibaculum sp.]|uniref:hypothetical protein n=1 Tax=Parvibaculum sp. TaxID=2024848 RepID=UPI0027314718|nr:hypothetical protein [Parvibaculum sp.]MDP1628817.1 hypothetical protein [Parvibaculum sp.]MDP2148212.1 hypothetical protein [Parvibaculum sp.]MDP3327726.1 hypothetical protein [Parvibaculum sp.]